MLDGRVERRAVVVAVSYTESRCVGTCEVCGGDVHQRWVITPKIGHASPIEYPTGEARCTTDERHDWRGLGR